MAKIRIKAFLKAVLWIVLSSSFGLLQLWIVLLLSKFSHSAFSVSVTEAINEGVILFLLSGIVATTAIDYYFSPDLKFPKWVEGICFALFPVIAMFLIVVAYSATHSPTPTSLGDEKVFRWQLFCCGITVIYAVVVKYLTFIKNYVE